MRRRIQRNQRPPTPALNPQALGPVDDKLNTEAWTLLSVGLGTGLTAFVGGLATSFHYSALLSAWAAFPILAGCFGGVALLNPLAEPPTADSVETKRLWVQRGIIGLVFSVLMAVGGAILLASIP